MLRGILPPLTTPFEGPAFSADRLRENVARYERAGVHGYLVLGSSGEAALLDEAEKLAVVETAREAIPATKPLLVGAGLESTAATIRLCAQVAQRGADAVLVVTPHYYASAMSAAALRDHFTAVADASPAPVLLYSVPKFTNVDLPVPVALELAAHPNVAGIKDSSGDLSRIEALVAGTGDGFDVVCGSHRIFLEARRAGAAAAILAAADVSPAAWVEIDRLAAEGREEEARRRYAEVAPLCDLAVSKLGVPGIKAAMELEGLYGGPPRPPLLPLDEEARAGLRRAREPEQR
jgi:4-hydroxy-2-oxoglutarate aldolase